MKISAELFRTVRKKNVLILFFCFLSFCLSVYAQLPAVNKKGFDTLSWYTMQQAYAAFDTKDFGSAFRLAETAKEQRKAESEWASNTLESALSVPALLKAGNDIETVLNLLRERNNADAVRIIEGVLARSGIEYFDYSIQNINKFIKNNRVYPEADFLLGKLYMLEGEYGLSEQLYSSAYKNRFYLDVPDMQFDILYDMAELYMLTDDNEKYESVLLILASQDEIYRSGGEPSAFIKAVRSAVERGMSADKLFLLYRNDNHRTLYVWLALTKYYYSLDLNDKAFETSLLFSLTALSRADNIIKSRELDYAYTDFDALLGKIQTYSDINEWAAENKVWEGFFLLGEIAQKRGSISFAQDIYRALVKRCPDRKWKILAEKALSR